MLKYITHHTVVVLTLFFKRFMCYAVKVKKLLHYLCHGFLGELGCL